MSSDHGGFDLKNEIKKSILLIYYRLINRKPLAVACKLHHAPKIINLSIYKGVIFFGYHDKTPFSGDDSKILSMSFKHNDTSPHMECKEIDLGYFHNSHGNNFVKFSSFWSILSAMNTSHVTKYPKNA